jgi:hypothetical protein
MVFSLRRSIVLAVGFAGLIALCASGKNVEGQTNPPPVVSPKPRLALTAEQEYIIREIIFKESNVQRENSAPETIGDVVPDSVKLYPLPPQITQKVPQARSHMFFVEDDKVILVSSSDRRVADVIKKKPTD